MTDAELCARYCINPGELWLLRRYREAADGAETAAEANGLMRLACARIDWERDRGWGEFRRLWLDIVGLT